MRNADEVADPQALRAPRKVAVLRQARAVRTRSELVAAAIRLWNAQDFDAITVDAIVAAAGVSKGTFFYHFRRKEDVLIELGWSTVDRVGEEAEEAYSRDLDLNRAMDVGLAGLARRITAMPRGAVARTIQEFVYRRSSESRSANSGRHAFMSGLLRAAQETGNIPSTIDADELSDVLNDVLIQTILHSVTGRSDEPLETMLRRRSRLVLYGMHQTAPQPSAFNGQDLHPAPARNDPSPARVTNPVKAKQSGKPRV